MALHFSQRNLKHISSAGVVNNKTSTVTEYDLKNPHFVADLSLFPPPFAPQAQKETLKDEENLLRLPTFEP